VLCAAGFVVSVLLVLWEVVAKAAESLDWEKPAEEVVLIFEESMTPQTPATIANSSSKPGLKFVRTEGVNDSGEPAKLGSADYISDKNTKAASEGPPLGPDKTLPSQKGLKTDVLDLVNKEQINGKMNGEERKSPEMGAQAKTTPKVEKTPETPKTLINTSPPETSKKLIGDINTTPISELIDQVAPPTPDKRPAPKPKVQETPKEQSVAGGTKQGSHAEAYQQQTRKNQLAGGISAQGAASVAAADTAMGRYMGRVGDAVSALFHPACKKNRGRLSYGVVQVEFDITPKGTVENLYVTEGSTGNAIMQDLVLGVILDAEMPAIPQDLSDYLIGDRLHITYSFRFN
jgi:TonB family protein